MLMVRLHAYSGNANRCSVVCGSGCSPRPTRTQCYASHCFFQKPDKPPETCTRKVIAARSSSPEKPPAEPAPPPVSGPLVRGVSRGKFGLHFLFLSFTKLAQNRKTMKDVASWFKLSIDAQHDLFQPLFSPSP